jgi:hypothetical protein
MPLTFLNYSRCSSLGLYIRHIDILTSHESFLQLCFSPIKMDGYHRWIIQKDEEEILDLINAYNYAPFTPVMPSYRIPCHTSILRGGIYVKEVLEGHPCHAKQEFRMETHIFHALVKILNEKYLLRNGNDITVEEQLAMFLYTLGKNASNRTVQEWFQHSGSSVSYYFGEVLNAILQLSKDMIKFPSSITPGCILNRSHFYPYFMVLYDLFNLYYFIILFNFHSNID